MHPPSWVCEALYRIDPNYRLAWRGYDSAAPNAGEFVVILLQHIEVTGVPGDTRCFLDFWNAKMCVLDDSAGAPVTHGWVRDEPGPIFNRYGGMRPDWDPLFVQPCLLYTFKTHEILDGSFLLSMRYYTRASKQERLDDVEKIAEQKARNVMSKHSDTRTAIDEDTRFKKKGHYHKAPILARKHYRNDPVVQQFYRYREEGAQKHKAYLKQKFMGVNL